MLEGISVEDEKGTNSAQALLRVEAKKMSHHILGSGACFLIGSPHPDFMGKYAVHPATDG